MMHDSARLGRNFVTITAAQFAVQVLTFLLSVALARTFGQSLYGLFVFGFAFPSLFLLLASAGLDDVIAVEVASNPSLARSYLTIVATTRLLLSLVAGLLLCIGVLIVFDDPFSRAVTLVLGTAALIQTYAGTFLSFFRAFERLEYTALALFVERGFTIGVAFALLWLGYGLLEIALSFFVGAGISLAAALVILRWRFTWFSPTFDPRRARRLLRTAVPFALGGVTSTVVLGTGPVLLTMLRTTSETGLFNAGFALLLMVLSVLTICHFVLLPTMSRIRATQPDRLGPVLQHIQRFVFSLGLPAAVGAALYGPAVLVLFFGPAFEDGIAPFQVLMVSVAISSACIGNAAALAASGRQTENLTVGFVGVIAQVTSSIFLITAMGPLGAALGFVIGSAVMGILGTLVTRRYVARIDLVNTLGPPALAAVIMGFVLFRLGLPLWLGVPVGAIVYFVSLFALGGIQKGDVGTLREAMKGALGFGG